MQQLQNLQYLIVMDCESVEVIFDLQRSNVNEGGHELAELCNQLQRVKLWGLDNLRHVWKKGPHVIQGSSFQNLSYFYVYECGSLRHVFTPSIAKVLVGLQTLHIYLCENLEAIVAKEDEEEEGGGMMLFPQLTTLSLEYLPKLLNMIPKPYTINWLSLKTLTLNNCGKLIETMNDTLQVTSNNMETQQVRELHNLTVSFPTSVLLQLEHLEELAICSYSSLEVVFDLQGLNVIQLAGAFQHLSSLTVGGCDGLRLVFTPPIAKLLSRLQTLEISGCKNLESIVEKEEEDVVEGGEIFILFPQLTSLSLKWLPKLLKITPTAYTFNWPSLIKLTLDDCAKLTETLYDTLKVALVNMEILKVNKLDNVTVFFPSSVLPQLQHLQLLDIRSCSSLEIVFDLQGLNVIQLAGAFQYLSSLTVEGCESLRHVFTPPIAKLLSRLQTLKISTCENMEAIVAKQEEEEYMVEGGGIFILFPQLTTLSLEKLPKLLNITPKAYTFNWQSLKKSTLNDCGELAGTLYDTVQLQNLRELSVRKCESVEVVFDLQQSNVNEGGHELAELCNQLQRVSLRGLDNLIHVWKKGLHVIQGSSFQNLSYLHVSGCGSLGHVLTPSIAKVLVGLQTIEIYECMNLEAIVANEDEEEEEEGGGMMLFPQLTTLSLKDLPNLLNMTPKPYTINWSSLKKLTLNNCEKLIETMNGTLQVISNNMETQQVRELHNLTVSFPTSVLLQLEHLKKLKMRSCNSIEVVFDLQGLNVIQLANACQYLRQLTIQDCDGLRHVFTPPIAKLLSRLQTLKIHNCKNLEAIVEKEEEEEDVVEGREIFVLFPQLTSLFLEGLPKLLNITLQGSFKNLSSLSVAHCDGLKHVFTPSTAKLLLGLKKVEISKCENLEAIVAEKDDEKEEGRLELGGGGGITVILFPKLTSLYLRVLQNLLTIMPKPYTFNRSSLKVIDCDKLQDIQ